MHAGRSGPMRPSTIPTGISRAVLDATGGKGANVILDPVGGEVFDRSLKCLAWEGRILPVGFTSGSIPSIKANRILLRNISIVGLYWSEYWKHSPARIRDAHDRLVGLYAEGKIRPLIHRIYPMADLISAFEDIRARKVIGKAVLRVDQSQ